MGFTHKLSHLQAVRALVAAITLGVILSTLQIFLDLRDQRRVASRTITQVVEIMRESAAQAIYNLDRPLAKRVVDGLFRYQPVQMAAITDNELGIVLAKRERLVDHQPLTHQLADLAMPNEGFDVPLLFKGQTLPIGALRVEVDNAVIALAFLKRAGWVILAGVVKNILLAFILLWVFHATLTRPLLALINNLGDLDPRSPDPSPLPVPPLHKDNELGLLTQTMNALLSGFGASIQQAQTAEQNLARVNENLEELVEARTRELKQALATVEKAREEAESGARAKAEFLATMSHEIRTPMNGILGMAQLLFKTDLNKDQHRQLDLLLKSGQGLLRIINDVLDVSKIDADRMVLEETGFDLLQTVRETTSLFAQNAEAKGIGFAKNLDPALPARVTGDPFRIRQVLFNLLDNAIKFTRAGRVTLDVRPGEAPDEILFSVRDTGEGVDPDLLPTLFQPFTQADETTTRKFGGTGLGLAISRRLALLMGGDLQAESAQGEGSVFTFRAPLPEAPGFAAAASQPVVVTPRTELEILLVEDNPINREVILSLLDALKCRTTVAVDGEEALARCAEKRFDLIFMDCLMPVMDGFAASRALRAREEEEDLPRTPIIALTAFAMPGDRARCLEAGMDDHIAKPVDLNRVQAMLVHWTRGNSPPGDPTPVGDDAPPPQDEPPSDEPLLDQALLTKLLGILKPRKFKQLVNIYKGNVPGYLDVIGAALDQGADHEEVKKAAHTLKGACRQLGALSAAALAERMENPAMASLSLLEELRTKVNETVRALEEVIPE